MACRLFVGAFVDDEWRTALSNACDILSRLEPAWRDDKWVPGPNHHVTLAFLGEVAEDEVEPLTERLTRAVSASTAFELPFRALEARPSHNKARMLWAALDDPDGSCAELAAAAISAGVPAGASRDDRPFRAHVTLCRARRPHRMTPASLHRAAVDSNVPATLSVRSVTLCSSRLSAGGAHYTALCSWTLAE